MSTSALFTVIVLNYNQEHVLYKAIDSVLSQSYDNIELVFSDDCSYTFDREKLLNYVEKNKSENLTNFIINVNETNSGTVKNVNNAIKKCNGEYVLFFAADDCLYDANTIANFVKSFETLPDDSLMITGQCYMYDEELKKLECKFVDIELAKQLNNDSALGQYKKMVFSCLYAMGATAVKRKIFEKYGLFNEKYKIIEDWSYFLNITRNGAKITYCNFGALKHRDGGVSHYNKDYLPSHVLAFKNDMLVIMEHEIIPYLSLLSRAEKEKVLAMYEQTRIDYGNLSAPNFRMKRINIILKNPSYYFKKTVFYAIEWFRKWLSTTLKSLSVLFISWIAFNLISLLLINLNSNLFKLNPLNMLIYNIIDHSIPIALLANALISAIFALSIFIYNFRKFFKRFFSNKI